MDLKTFRAASTREALRQVRMELGDDALVLDTREGREADGRKVIEVVAALDRKPARAGAAGAASAAGATEELSFDELATLCSMARSGGERTPGRKETRVNPDGAARTLLDRLRAIEVRPAVARRLIDETVAERPANLSRALNERIGRVLGATLPAAATRPRVLAFVGPTGVGKTTTTAKLAARLGRVLGARVGLVAADAFRIGAVEQLRIYADLLGVPFRAAQSPGEVDGAIQKLAGCDWVLVDTAGKSPREAARDGEWPGFFAARPWIERLLVLAANVRESDLDAAVDAYWGLAPQGLVFTKIDEAAALGGIVNQAVRTSLPVGFLANGQNVPDDLVVTTPRGMAELVLNGNA